MIEDSITTTLVCWHCGKTGHNKETCLDYYLERAMNKFFPMSGNEYYIGQGTRFPPTCREIVKEEALAILQAALREGKRGAQLEFGGAPWMLKMVWPFRSTSRWQPKFPTAGVWHLGKYYGIDL